MVRRYALPVVVIMIVALASGGLAYAGSSGTTFSASCSFQVFIHLSRAPVTTPDNAKFISLLAGQQVTTAIAGGVVGRVAKDLKVSPALLAASQTTRVQPGLGTFTTTVARPNPRDAVRIANAICDRYVAVVKQQRANEISAQVKRVQDRIATIQAEIKKLEDKPARNRTAADTAALQGQRQALVLNARQVAEIISLPPDDIAVLSHAAAAGQKETGNLTKNLLIAMTAGLLASFLFILVGEIVAERRRSGVPGVQVST